jgi:hypothetical protein
MKNNQKILTIMGFLLGSVALCLMILSLLNFVSRDVTRGFSGIFLLFEGLIQINTTQQQSSTGIKFGNKNFASIIIIIGILMISRSLFSIITAT